MTAAVTLGRQLQTTIVHPETFPNMLNAYFLSHDGGEK